VDQWYSPTYAGHLAEAVVELLEMGERPQVLHVAGPRLSRLEFALAVAEVFRLPKDLVRPAYMAEMRWAASRPRDSSLDTSLARRLLKVPFWDLSAALERFKEEFVGRYASG